jgi:hypothetical protein
MLIEDPSSGGWFTMSSDGLIVGINEFARMEAPRPVPATELMPVIADRFERAIDESRGIEGAAGGGGPVVDRRLADADTPPPWLWLGGGALVLLGIGATTIWVRRRSTGTR